MVKITPLNQAQKNSFTHYFGSVSSGATVCLQGTYLQELKDCGINPRIETRNELICCILTKFSGSQMGIETVFYDKRDQQCDGDLHLVNFASGNLSSHYQGWGTCVEYYGDKHHENKDHLRIGTVSSK